MVMFFAFSVIGNGGENFARIFSLNSTGESDSAGGLYALLAMIGGSVPEIQAATRSNLSRVFLSSTTTACLNR